MAAATLPLPGVGEREATRRQNSASERSVSFDETPMQPGQRGAASYPRAGAKPRLLRAGVLLASLPLLPCVLACHTTPVTGRSSLNIFSTADDIQLGREAYAQVLENAEIVKSGPNRDMVQRAMTRLTAVADDPGFEW